MKEDGYSKTDIGNDLEYVAKKLDWSPEEFRAIISLPPNRHENFPSNESLFRFGMSVRNFFR